VGEKHLPIHFYKAWRHCAERFETLPLTYFQSLILGKQIPISPSVAFLYPTIRMWEFYSEANFGDDPAKPFEYDVKNCPGLGLACI
jgi:hypothetical protein